MTTSSPVPPPTTSSPEPPWTLSSPASPSTQSSPDPPVATSSPVPANTTSSPAPPCKISLSVWTTSGVDHVTFMFTSSLSLSPPPSKSSQFWFPSAALSTAYSYPSLFREVSLNKVTPFAPSIDLSPIIGSQFPFSSFSKVTSCPSLSP